MPRTKKIRNNASGPRTAPRTRRAAEDRYSMTLRMEMLRQQMPNLSASAGKHDSQFLAIHSGFLLFLAFSVNRLQYLTRQSVQRSQQGDSGDAQSDEQHLKCLVEEILCFGLPFRAVIDPEKDQAHLVQPEQSGKVGPDIPRKLYL